MDGKSVSFYKAHGYSTKLCKDQSSHFITLQWESSNTMGFVNNSCTVCRHIKYVVFNFCIIRGECYEIIFIPVYTGTPVFPIVVGGLKVNNLGKVQWNLCYKNMW